MKTTDTLDNIEVVEKSTQLGPDDDTQKKIKLKMFFDIENNNSFVRGKSRSLKDIEYWVFSQHDIKTIDKDGGRYEITLEYTTYEDLDEQLEELVREADSIADGRHCFTEFDFYTFDGERSWPFARD
jgi:hypothetical protein